MPPTAGSKTGFVYVNELGNENPGKSHVTSRLRDPSKDYSEQNHIPSSKSSMSLRQQLITNYDSSRSKSVTSLSVGVQCNPSDVSNTMKQINRSSSDDMVKANSRTALIEYGDNEDDEDENDCSLNSNILRKHYEYNNCKQHQHNGKSYRRPLRRVHPKTIQGIGINKNLHFSDPDFRLSSYRDDDDEDDDEIIPLIQSQYYVNPKKRKIEKQSNYQTEPKPR